MLADFTRNTVINLAVSATYLVLAIPGLYLVYRIRHHQSLRGNATKLFIAAHACVLIYSVLRILGPIIDIPCPLTDALFAILKFGFVWLFVLRYLRVFAYHIIGMAISVRLVSQNHLAGSNRQLAGTASADRVTPQKQPWWRCRGPCLNMHRLATSVRCQRVWQCILGRRFLHIWMFGGWGLYAALMIFFVVQQDEPMDHRYPLCTNIAILNSDQASNVTTLALTIGYVYCILIAALILLFALARIKDTSNSMIKICVSGGVYIIGGTSVRPVTRVIDSVYVTTYVTSIAILVFCIDLIAGTFCEIFCFTSTGWQLRSRLDPKADNGQPSMLPQLTRMLKETRIDVFEDLEYTPERFDQIFQNDAELAIFYDYARQRYCYENLAFLIEVHRFRSNAVVFSHSTHRFMAAREATSEDLVQIRNIYQRFIAPLSAQEININSELRGAIGQALADASISVSTNVFDSTFSDIYTLCFNDTYRRFSDDVRHYALRLPSAASAATQGSSTLGYTKSKISEMQEVERPSSSKAEIRSTAEMQ